MNDLGGAGEALALMAAGVGVLLLALIEGMDEMAKRKRQGQTPDDPPPETHPPPLPVPPPDLERDPVPDLDRPPFDPDDDDREPEGDRMTLAEST